MTNDRKRSAAADQNPASSTTTPAKKRKIDGVQKFYAVRAGKKPGVYLNYADCQGQVAGFRGAVCRYSLLKLHSVLGGKGVDMADSCG